MTIIGVSRQESAIELCFQNYFLNSDHETKIITFSDLSSISEFMIEEITNQTYFTFFFIT